MKRFFYILAGAVCLTACTTNPPAWWNPGNRYGQSVQPAAEANKPIRATAPVIKEEDLETLPDNSYEEELIEIPVEEYTPSPDELPAPSVLD